MSLRTVWLSSGVSSYEEKAQHGVSSWRAKSPRVQRKASRERCVAAGRVDESLRRAIRRAGLSKRSRVVGTGGDSEGRLHSLAEISEGLSTCGKSRCAVEQCGVPCGRCVVFACVAFDSAASRVVELSRPGVCGVVDGTGQPTRSDGTSPCNGLRMTGESVWPVLTRRGLRRRVVQRRTADG